MSRKPKVVGVKAQERADRGEVFKTRPGEKGSLQAAREGYTLFIGTLLAPKSLYPVSIYIDRSLEFRAFSPNRKVYIGGGYFGSEEGEVEGVGECVRQHMLPGVANREDRRKGLGTSLYLAGAMVRAATLERYDDACTMSLGDDRSVYADQAWESLVKHGLAEEITGDQTDDFSFELDAEALLDRGDIAEEISLHFDNATDIDIQGFENEYFSVYGEYTVEGVPQNAIEWKTVTESGLVLYLSPNQDFDTDTYTAVPPAAIAEIDWSQTPYTLFQDIIVQQGIMDGSPLGYAREAASALRSAGMRLLAELAEDANAERRPDRRAPLVRKRRNPASRRQRNAEARAWTAEYLKGTWD